MGTTSKELLDNDVDFCFVRYYATNLLRCPTGKTDNVKLVLSVKKKNVIPV